MPEGPGAQGVCVLARCFCLTQAGPCTGALDDSVLAGVVEDRTLG